MGLLEAELPSGNPAIVEDFQITTRRLLGAIGVNAAESLNSLSVEELVGVGFEHMVLDYDGVIAPYGEPPQKLAMDCLEEMSDLPCGVSVVSNNRTLTVTNLPPNVSVVPPDSIFDFKPLSRRIKRAVQMSGASPETTVGVGDGLTDILAFRAAGLGGLCLVKSCGAHPLQELVHRRVYSPILNLIDRLL